MIELIRDMGEVRYSIKQSKDYSVDDITVTPPIIQRDKTKMSFSSWVENNSAVIDTINDELVEHLLDIFTYDNLNVKINVDGLKEKFTKLMYESSWNACKHFT